MHPSIRFARTGPMPSRALLSSVVSRNAAPAAVVLVALVGLMAGAMPAHALKVATWNLNSYPSDSTGRNPNLRTVLAALDPDVITIQELTTVDGRNGFLSNVLNAVQPGQWTATSYFATCQSAFFYKTAKVTMLGAGPIATGGPRDVLTARIRLAGYASKLAETRLYSVHFKAGDAPADVTAREAECANLRNNLNAATPTVTSNFLVCGDTNFYGDGEGGYQRLTESQADNDGRGKDPLTMPGTWNQYAYAAYHTQSTCSGCPYAYYASGGLDDRFDLFLTSYPLQDGEGLDLIPGAYLPYGNDAQHYNQSVNGGGVNYAVGLDIATALYYASDHLPVMVTLQAPAKVLAVSTLGFGSVIVGATAEQPLTVTNGAAVPADELNYSLAAPTGFAAPAGSFTANAGVAGNVHAISMVTTDPGVKSGALTVSCDDPDSTAKPVQLSGTVLAHAAASLDSTTVTTESLLDFGTHDPGDFADLPVRVHNAGWVALQAKLEVTGGVISGGAGRFSIVGGFEAAELAGVGHTYALRFDGTDATADSLYEATLVLSGTDEPLPGAAAASDLTVTLRAQRSPGGTDVATQLPDRVAFLPPSPNPFRGTTTLRFDLQHEADVALELFDLSGRRVSTILQGRQPAGRHSLQMSPQVGQGGPLQAGLYFVSFRTGDFSQTRRLVLIP
jgi:endonuclease/exonuclease/phosphatase family metal-dependent hydrolase